MVFGSSHHDEEFGVFKVGATKLPERATNGIDHTRRHIDRAKAAVRCVVGRTKLTGKKTCERLHLIAPGKKRKLLGVGPTKGFQPFTQKRKGLIPRNRIVLTLASISPRSS